MMYLGDFDRGATIYVPFHTFNSAGASVTMTGFAVTDIEIYKNGSVTQRASDNGYTLLDTDGTDFDSATGIHGFSIDTSDNSTAGFWAPKSEYFVVVNAVTIDSQTVRFIAATFSIENRALPGLLMRTVIASVTSQVIIVLTDGSADDDAYNNGIAIFQDVSTSKQRAFCMIDDYVGSTGTLTLRTAPAFTIAANDHVTLLAQDPTANLRLPAALTGGGNIKADALAINGSTAAAAAQALAAIGIVASTCAASSTTTVVNTNLTEATNDHYNGRSIVFTSGALLQQAATITDYNGTTKALTVSTLTEAPANTDAFVIV